jgi:hypothetical protein
MGGRRIKITKVKEHLTFSSFNIQYSLIDSCKYHEASHNFYPYKIFLAVLPRVEESAAGKT